MSKHELADCVWAELLVRLEAFQVDALRAQFDTWLFRIVRSKVANLQRARRRRPPEEQAAHLHTLIDIRPGPSESLAETESAAALWKQLRERLSDDYFRVLHLRIVEGQSVAAIAQRLHISRKQTSALLYRALRRAQPIVSSWRDQCHEKG